MSQPPSVVELTYPDENDSCEMLDSACYTATVTIKAFGLMQASVNAKRKPYNEDML
jgi:hypothetical protein